MHVTIVKCIQTFKRGKLGMEPLDRLTLAWENSSEKNLKGIRWKVEDWVYLIRDRDYWDYWLLFCFVSF
jgi:hypothetical protein